MHESRCVLQAPEDLGIAMRDHDGTQHQAQGQHAKRLQAVKKLQFEPLSDAQHNTRKSFLLVPDLPE